MARVATDTSVHAQQSIQTPRSHGAGGAQLDDAFTQMVDAATAEPARPAAREPAPRTQADRPRRNEPGDAARPRRDDRPATNRAADRPAPRDTPPAKGTDAEPAPRETASETTTPAKAATGDSETAQAEQPAAAKDAETEAPPATSVVAALIEIAAATQQTTTPTLDPSLAGEEAVPTDAAASATPGEAEAVQPSPPASNPVTVLVAAAAAQAAATTAGDGTATTPGAAGAEITVVPQKAVAGQGAEQKPDTDKPQPDAAAAAGEQGIAPPAEATGEPNAETQGARDPTQAKHPTIKDNPGRGPEHRPEVGTTPPPSVDFAAAPGQNGGQAHAATVANTHALNAPASSQGVAHGVPGGAAANAPAVPVEGLAIEIAARLQQGKHRFEIRLDPPELGRIDVRLDVDKEGQVTSRLLVDRVETLELLKRDASQLERALQQAGLKMGDSGLQFQLRDQSFAGQQDQQKSGQSSQLIATDPELPATEIASGYGRLLGSRGGLDIRV